MGVGVVAVEQSVVAAEGGSLRDGIWNDRPYAPNHIRRKIMGRGILLWLLGVPIPIIILLALFWH